VVIACAATNETSTASTANKPITHLAVSPQISSLGVMFNIDTGGSKDFSLGEQRRIEFSWQAFNATNSVRYDVRGAQPSLSFDPTQFGKYHSTLTSPRFMQFALRFAF
jgi:hypothetical protein